MTMFNPKNFNLSLIVKADFGATLTVVLIAIILLLDKQQGSL